MNWPISTAEDPQLKVLFTGGTSAGTATSYTQTPLWQSVLQGLEQQETSNTDVPQREGERSHRSYVFHVYSGSDICTLISFILPEMRAAGRARWYWHPCSVRIDRFFELLGEGSDEQVGVTNRLHSRSSATGGPVSGGHRYFGQHYLVEYSNWTGVPTNAQSESANLEGDQTQLHQDVEALFRAAAQEVFEYGMESEFTRALENVLMKHGTAAVKAIARVILRGDAEPEVAAEALHWLGSVYHRDTYDLRFKLLVACLRYPSRWVRDGAALGLDAMNDPRAIRYLRAAVARESVPLLRDDLESLMVRLEQAA